MAAEGQSLFLHGSGCIQDPVLQPFLPPADGLIRPAGTGSGHTVEDFLDGFEWKGQMIGVAGESKKPVLLVERDGLSKPGQEKARHRMLRQPLKQLRRGVADLAPRQERVVQGGGLLILRPSNLARVRRAALKPACPGSRGMAVK